MRRVTSVGRDAAARRRSRCVGWGLVVVGRVQRAARRVASCDGSRDATHAADDVALDRCDRRRTSARRPTGSRTPKRCSTGCWPRSTRRPTAIVVVDRIGREVVRNAAARRFARRAPRRRARRGRDRRAAAARARRGDAAERELQLYGPPRQVLQLRVVPAARATARSSARSRSSRDVSETAPGRERAARLRRQREPRAEDADRRARPARRDDGGDRRRRRSCSSSPTGSCARPTGSRSIVDDLLDLSQIEAQEAPTREPLPGARCSSREAVDLVQAAADVGRRAAARSRPSRPTSRSSATAARCAARSSTCSTTRSSTPDAGRAGRGRRAASTATGSRSSCATTASASRRATSNASSSASTGSTARAAARPAAPGSGSSIVRHVAQAHGGEVTVESREGEGSTFTLHAADRHDAADPRTGTTQSRRRRR